MMKMLFAKTKHKRRCSIKILSLPTIFLSISVFWLAPSVRLQIKTCQIQHPVRHRGGEGFKGGGTTVK